MLGKRCLFGSGSGLGCKLGATVHAFQQRKMCTHVKHNLGPPNFCVQTFYKLLPSCCERHIIYTDSHFLPNGARVTSITERYRCLCLLSRRVTDKSFMKVYHHCLPPKQMRKSTPRLLQTCWQRLKRWQRKEIGKAKKKIFPIFFRCHVLRFRRAHCCASCFVMRR